MNYRTQLQDPKWKAKRKFIITRDNNKCSLCNSSTNLVVHHKEYINGMKAWEYDDSSLITLCSKCHAKFHDQEVFNFRTKNISNTYSKALLNSIHNNSKSIICKPFIKTSVKELKASIESYDIWVNPLAESLIIPVNNNTFYSGGDKRERTMVYTHKHLRTYISGLSPKSRTLYLWLIYSIEYGKDYLWINVARYMRETNTSLNTYKDAIKDLCNANIMFPMLNQYNMFWINPLFFFKGDATNKYKDKLVLYKDFKTRNS